MGGGCLLLLVLAEFIHTVVSEVAPPVVGTGDWCEGQGGLDFVEEHLKEHVLILGIAAIEDELQVAAHGEDVGTPPTFFLEFVEIICFEVVAVDTYEAYQGEQHRLVSKAQLGSRIDQLNATVGIGNEAFEQVSLTLGLATAIELAGAVLYVPKGVVDLPHAIECVQREELD